MKRIDNQYCILERKEVLFELKFPNGNQHNFIVYKDENDGYRINTYYEFLDDENIKIYREDYELPYYDIHIPNTYLSNNNVFNCTIDTLIDIAYNTWMTGAK